MPKKSISSQTKKFDFSYTFGVNPTLELLKKKKQFVKKVYLTQKSSRNKGVQEIINICKKSRISFEISDHTVGKLSPKENSLVVGIFDKYECFLDPQQDHVVLLGVRDMGNLGGVIRSMHAFGFSNLALIKPSAHIFDPKVIRASMGNIFGVNFEYFDSLEDYAKAFREHKIQVCSIKGKKLPLTSASTARYSIVFSENPVEGTNYAQFSIPAQDSAALNVSVSVGIALYSLRNYANI